MTTDAEDVARRLPPADAAPVKGFQFIEGKPQVLRKACDEEKENQGPTDDSNGLRPLQDEHHRIATRPFPSTPATRLPLSDLLGNAEDRRNAEADANISPEEQISWNTVGSPRSSATRKTPAPRKRRARSSSPPSTTQRKSARKQTFELDAPRCNLKTPKIDPAADLWSRYAVQSDVDQQADTRASSVANLTYPSSPYAQVHELRGGNVGGLRRWTSCGMEWPSSKAKRRKTNHVGVIKEQVDEAFSAGFGADISDDKQPSKSKLTSLIERIQGSLDKPCEPIESRAPSSSSPLPEAKDSLKRASQPHTSPCKTRSTHSRSMSGVDTAGAELSMQQGSISDILGVDTVIPVSLTKLDDAGGSVTTRPAANPRVASVTEHAPMLDDDFGDDEELTADDFEAVASLCDEVVRPAGVQVPTTAAKFDATSALTRLPSNDFDDFDDEDLDEDSFAAAEAAATQMASSTSLVRSDSPTTSQRIIQRYLVQDVISDGTYNDHMGREQPEKMVLVEDEKTKLNKIVVLRQSWLDTRCTKGSFVHVIGEFDFKGQCIIDDAQNLLILHPDQLISALVVADSFTCMRRSVLQDRIKATGEASAPMVYGTMLHELFQQAMLVNRWDCEWFQSAIQALVARHIEDLYQIKLSMEQAVEHLSSKITALQSWAEVFVKATPGPDAIVKNRNGKEVTMSVNKLLDVEEHVWSPMFGLKGNIDATVQIAMRDDEGERTLTVPFEVKTGKNSSNASHRAQTALYTLLLSDRYDLSVAYGVLYYLETSEISRVPAIRHELRDMIMQRNELACYVRERLSLPPMVRNTHQCNRCYAKTACFIYHKLVEDGDGETSGLRAKFDAVVGELSPTHREFFRKWDDLLTKEESDIFKFKRELWTMLSEDREKHGRCFAKVVLDHGAASEEATATKINQFRYTFHKQDESISFNFNESHMAVGEPIVVSDERGHYALALGYVVQLGKSHITVAVDRRLRNARIRQPGFDALTNQTFAGVMEVEGTTASTEPQRKARHEPAVYRIDKDEFSNGLASVRNNLIQIMSNDVFRAREIRGLVVDGVEPRFKPVSTSYNLSGPLSQLSINDDQREAIEKVMSAEDYALVLGMPGTGKTTTIAHIIRALVAKGKSVLLTSYTHTAVDNILLKLRHDKVDILRLGASAKVLPEVRDFVRLASEPGTTIEELETMYNEPQVVATTCLGINHQIFNERIFDYCIVDEASQITLPVCLGPIRMAKVFVLVGDHYQLPPLVQNRQAQEGGLDVSLFRLLSEAHPAALTTLKTQYRMNETIMSVSNKLIYDGKLVCGSEEVAKKTSRLPEWDALRQLHQGTASSAGEACASHDSQACWIYRTLHQASPPVVFLNTDGVLPTSAEKAHGARITNPFEAQLMTQVVQALLMTGVEPSSIGLITLYRSQLALIKSLLQSAVTPGQVELLEADTTDRFQGRDKDVIVLSCVRNNDRNIVGELLKDWRRVNVAVTRAKKKLIIIGSRGTLSRGDELLGKLVEMCVERGWLVDLPGSVANASSHSWRIAPASANLHAQTTEPTEQGATDAMSDQALPGSSALPGVGGGPQRRPLHASKTNTSAGNVNRAFKPPTKIGKVNAHSVLTDAGGSIRSKRPVLADIISNLVGEIP